MAKLLYFLNTKNQTYFTKYLQFCSKIDIGDTDYHGHVLVNVLHCGNINNRVYSMSFKDFDVFCDLQVQRFLKHDHETKMRNIKMAISERLIKLARRISK